MGTSYLHVNGNAAGDEPLPLSGQLINNKLGDRVPKKIKPERAAHSSRQHGIDAPAEVMRKVLPPLTMWPLTVCKERKAG